MKSLAHSPRLLALTAGALVIVSVGAGAMSLALFTDTATVDANTFSTGTLEISTNPTTAVVSYADMAPGDQITAPLTVSNDGSLDLRYSVTSVATNADTKGLKDQLVLTIRSGVAACTDLGFASSGSEIYTGDLDGAAGVVIGSATSGAQAGDRDLAATASEILCFNVTLPLATGNAFQGATTTATFTFDAEQTANN